MPGPGASVEAHIHPVEELEGRAYRGNDNGTGVARYGAITDRATDPDFHRLLAYVLGPCEQDILAKWAFSKI
jgi:hypothetical protein